MADQEEDEDSFTGESHIGFDSTGNSDTVFGVAEFTVEMESDPFVVTHEGVCEFENTALVRCVGDPLPRLPSVRAHRRPDEEGAVIVIGPPRRTGRFRERALPARPACRARGQANQAYEWLEIK